MKKILSLILILGFSGLFIPQNTFAARLYSTGTELQSVTNGVEWDTTTGTPTINTTTKRSGAASLRCNPTAATAYLQHTFANHPTGTARTYYFRFYLNITTSTDALDTIFEFRDAFPFQFVSVRLNSNRTLELWDDEAVAQIGSDSSALNAGQWYRIEVEIPITSADAVGTVKAYIDGTQFASGVGSGGLEAGNWSARVGCVTATTADLYFDDIAVNDSTGSAQTGLPGAGSIVHLHPNGAGDNAAEAGTFADVDEVTPDDNNTRITLETSTSIADYAMEASSVPGIGASDTISLIEVGIRNREVLSLVTSYQLRIKSASGGTTSLSTATDGGSTTWRSNSNGTDSFAHRLVSYTDPTTGVAWTPTGTNSLDNMQIGQASLTDNDLFTSTLWALVEYVPAAGGGGVTLATFWQQIIWWWDDE